MVRIVLSAGNVFAASVIAEGNNFVIVLCFSVLCLMRFDFFHCKTFTMKGFAVWLLYNLQAKFYCLVLAFTGGYKICIGEFQCYIAGPYKAQESLLTT